MTIKFEKVAREHIPDSTYLTDKIKEAEDDVAVYTLLQYDKDCNNANPVLEISPEKLHIEVNNEAAARRFAKEFYALIAKFENRASEEVRKRNLWYQLNGKPAKIFTYHS